ncbi:hypothetical protein ADUPG1_012467 [Aduncisulcus paluster]|uniref:Protein kinase domain-containing protein n=1 Tax=Aduncisulcus paluster TaxID=2918883 RepID=A0ABQ5JZJ3_9EUKA|nr:hypothetical protein ADUPG1_012467 [Aduncisulcus paluster]
MTKLDIDERMSVHEACEKVQSIKRLLPKIGEGWKCPSIDDIVKAQLAKHKGDTGSIVDEDSIPSVVLTEGWINSLSHRKSETSIDEKKNREELERLEAERKLEEKKTEQYRIMFEEEKKKREKLEKMETAIRRKMEEKKKKKEELEKQEAERKRKLEQKKKKEELERIKNSKSKKQKEEGYWSCHWGLIWAGKYIPALTITPNPKILTSYSDITPLCIIGSGGFGDVILARIDYPESSSPSILCALKCMKNDSDHKWNMRRVERMKKEFFRQCRLYSIPSQQSCFPQPLHIRVNSKNRFIEKSSEFGR